MARYKKSEGKQPRVREQRTIPKKDRVDLFWAYSTEYLPTNMQLTLLDNVQFIYELALAQLELQALRVHFEIMNGFREFKLLDVKDAEDVGRRVAYFKYVKGKLTDYFQLIQKNRTRSVNQYLTHWIYPYKGKFHPQMIRALLNIIGLEPGDTVLDPFIGSGTTAVEAQLLGINCIGFDVSPLCVVQSKVKTESAGVLPQIVESQDEITKRIRPSVFDSVEQKTVDEAISSIPDERVKNFYKMAKLVAISDNARRGREFSHAFLKNIDLMTSSVSDYVEITEKLSLKLGCVDIKTGDSRKLPLEKESIDGIITSPPYSIALDYVINDAHALRALGYDLPEIREEFIGVRGKGQERVDLYNEDMKFSLQEMSRVLKPNRYAVIVIGNATYQGRELETVQFVADYAEKVGLKLVKNVDKIIFGLYNVMQKENILIFKKVE